MSTTNGNLKNLKVTDPHGNVYVLVPVDTEARQAIEEAKELTFDENYFTAEETDTEVHFGLNGVPIGVEDTTPLQILQDDQYGLIFGADTLFTSSLVGSAYTPFSSASTYDVNQKVVHDSKLYNCTTAVSVAGVWNNANWTEIPLIDLANQYTLSAIQDLATKAYVDSLVVSSVSAAASITYVSANYVDKTTFNAYSADVTTTFATKVDKVEGKGLSEEDFTSILRAKLDSIASSAEVNVQSNWTETSSSSDAYILNKPTKLSDFTDDLAKDNVPVSGSNNYVKSGGVYANEQVLVQSVNELKQDIEGLKNINTFDELYANEIHLMSIPYVGDSQMIITGTGTPVSTVEPEYVGQIYLDTTNKVIYQAFGTTTTDWKSSTTTDNITSADLNTIWNDVFA